MMIDCINRSKTEQDVMTWDDGSDIAMVMVLVFGLAVITSFAMKGRRAIGCTDTHSHRPPE